MDLKRKTLEFVLSKAKDMGDNEEVGVCCPEDKGSSLFPGEEADWINLLHVYAIFQAPPLISGFDSILVLC